MTFQWLVLRFKRRSHARDTSAWNVTSLKALIRRFTKIGNLWTCHTCVYVIYIVNILYSYYIYIYIAYICRVKGEWYIHRTSFTTYIVEPTCSMVLRITSSGNKVQGCPGSIPGRVLKIGKKACIIYMYCISYM